MILFRDLLLELEIQPNIPDPIKRKGLHVGDIISWGKAHELKSGTITKIKYFQKDIIEYFSNLTPVNSWQKADFVRVETNGPDNLVFYKYPEIELQKEVNSNFNMIQKIHPIQELEIQPNIPDPIKRKNLHIGDKIKAYSIDKTPVKGKITYIEYYAVENKEHFNSKIVNSWQEADYVMIGMQNHYFLYYKNPQSSWEKFHTNAFKNIQKIN